MAGTRETESGMESGTEGSGSPESSSQRAEKGTKLSPGGTRSPGAGTRATATFSSSKKGPGSNAPILLQNRQFLDFFWDIAKPEQPVRLQAIKGLLEYLKRPDCRDDELQYTIKRLIDGLAATRETTRPGFSLALAQLLQHNEDIPLQRIMEQMAAKYDMTQTKRRLFRNAVFGNLFGVLALSQSGRLLKEPAVLLQSIQLLQKLSHFKQYLSNLPKNTIVDILSETPETVFEEILFETLKADLSSAFSDPDHFHLLLVALQRFPNVLKPQMLKTLLGSTILMSSENILKLDGLLKSVAKTLKEVRTIQPLISQLIDIVLKEGTFEIFWKELVENGLLKHQSGPSCFLCYCLLGATLPLLTLPQLNFVLTGEVMRHYGNHLSQPMQRGKFRFTSEMEAYVDSFLANTQDAEKQFSVITKFTCLINHGQPVIHPQWKVVHQLQPSVLLDYVSWLKNMFVSPNFETCIDVSTKQQMEFKEQASTTKHMRLRAWIVARLSSIIGNNQVKKDDDLVMDIVRFVFFHGFFVTEHQTPNIPETEATLSVPLDKNTHMIVANLFYRMLNHLNSLPPLGNSTESVGRSEKRMLGITADGNLWIFCVIRYANALLSEEQSVRLVKPIKQEQREAWDRMLKSVEDLRKKSKKFHRLQISAFQLLILLIGIHLFKDSDDTVTLLNDLHVCLQKAVLNKRKSDSKPVTDEEEPEWVEVMVEILLSLLSQSNRLMRQVVKTVFAQICPYVTKAALQLILDVFKTGDDESAVIVTEELDGMDKVKQPPGEKMEMDTDSDEEQDATSDEEDNEDESDSEMEATDNFRMELMKILQAGHAAPQEGESSDDADDETMMALDKNISSLFAEHKKRLQAKKNQAAKLRKEKSLRTDFQIKALDLIEVFLVKQPESPLVFDIIEPMTTIIERTQSSHLDLQTQDFLRKTADIFKNQLCKAKHYCQDVSEIKEDLHQLMEQLLSQACKQPDSSVSLYCFSGALFLFRVLKGSPTEPASTSASKEEGKQEPNLQTESGQVNSLGSLDIVRVTKMYKKALSLFMTKRNCSLTGCMFEDLFRRFPIMCCQLLRPAIKYITNGVRQHQQAQACHLVLKALQTQEVKETLLDVKGGTIITRVIKQTKKCLKNLKEIKQKVDQEKVTKCLELISAVIKMIHQQKLDVSVSQLARCLQKLGKQEAFGKSSHMRDMYYYVMKQLGFKQPKKEEVKVKAQAQTPAPKQEVLKKKKKGFLPQTKKRKNWKKKKGSAQENVQEGKENLAGESVSVPKPAGVGQEKRRNKRKNLEKGATGKPESAVPIKKAKTHAVEMGQGDMVGKQVTMKHTKPRNKAAKK